MVDPIHPTSSTVHKDRHLISGSLEIPLVSSTGNSSSIGKEPVPCGRPIFTSIGRSATRSEVSYAEKSIVITSTNVLQVHETVVLVCCAIEGEPDVTCIQKGRNNVYVLDNC